MHELSIAQAILDSAAETLGGARPLSRVTLRIGVLSGVSPDALRFAFPELASALGFGAPELSIVDVPARATCASCGAAYDLEDTFAPCPACGSVHRALSGGDELLIESIEYPEDDDG